MVNDVSGEGVGIDADRNAATFLTPSTSIELPEMTKRKLADRILDEIVALRRPRPLVFEVDEGTDKPQDKVLSESAAPADLAPPASSWSSPRCRSLDPATREALEARLRFYRELGLTDFYRRAVDASHDIHF